MRRDYERLAQQTRSEAWTDDTPVPPFVFDPLDNSDPTLPGAAFVLSLFAPANTDPHVIGDGVMKLWEAANEYHMARGGGVLTFDQFKQMMPALVPVGPLVGS